MRDRDFAVVLIFLLVLTICYAETIEPNALIIITNQPPNIVGYNISASINDFITITPNATDPNGDALSYNFSTPFNSSGEWQTSSSSGGIYNVDVTVYDEEFSDSAIHTITVKPYCGDGHCNSTYESCLSCVTDCGQCPVISSGGGGGGSSGYSQDYVDSLQAEIERLKDKAISNNTPQFELAVNKLDVRVEYGEFVGKRMKIKNIYQDKTLFLKTLVNGDVNQSIVVDSKYLTIEPGEELDLNMLFLGNRKVGTYTGFLLIVSTEYYEKIPISLTIIPRIDIDPDLETLDVDLDVLTQEINPGGKLKYKITLRKTPVLSDEEDNVILKEVIFALTDETISMLTGASITDITSYGTENFLYSEKNLTVLTQMSEIIEVDIPRNFITGEYILNLNINFRDKNIPISTKFNVQKSSSFNFLSDNLVYFVVLMMGLFLLMLFIVSKHSSSYEINATYLPTKTERSGYLGKAAGTNQKAYIDMEDLMTHVIIAGSTGTGKTIAAQVIAEEVLRHKIPVIVFDPTTQWSGFFKKCENQNILKTYKQFGLKEAEKYSGKVFSVQNPLEILNIKSHLDKPEITIYNIDDLSSEQIDLFVANTIKDIFDSDFENSDKLKLLIVYDEVHRLLPRFGGSGHGFMQLERAIREFRKFGIGILLISQALNDFISPIQANIATHIQLRTNDKDDIERLNERFDEKTIKSLQAAPVGTALFFNPSYKNFFLKFRPILHSFKGLSLEELKKHYELGDKLNILSKQIKLISEKKDTFELNIELELAYEQLVDGKYDLADIYVDSLEKKVNPMLEKYNIDKNIDKKFFQQQEIQEDIKKVKEEDELLKKRYQDEIVEMSALLSEIKKGKELNMEKYRDAILKLEIASKTRELLDIQKAKKVIDDLSESRTRENKD